MIGSLVAAAALLLAGAGVAKAVAPAPAAATVQRVWSRLSTPLPVLRVAGGLELIIGGNALLVGTRAAAIALVGCYLVFVAVTLRLVRGGGRAPCGCFGRSDGDIGAAHLVLNLTCVTFAAAAASRPPGALCGLAHGGALVTAIGAGQTVLLAYLGYLSITALPALAAARRQLLEAR
jgi:hypothetical protein